MKKRINEYTYTDLLNDDAFIKDHSVLRKNTAKWERMVFCGELNRDAYLKACELIGCYSMLVSADDFNVDKTWEMINLATQPKQTRSFGLYCMGAAAAALLLMAGWGMLSVLHEGVKDANSFGIESVAKPILAEQSTDVQLIVGDEQKYTLENNASVDYSQSNTATVNSKPVAVHNRVADKTAVRYNQLVVPKGKRSQLILEDGSKVWVNAGSRVVYPVTFDQTCREIFIEGEVFLDVTKDAQRPFIVKTQDLNIKVLGTTFNVKSSLHNADKEITLVTGRVVVEDAQKKAYTLHPSQQLKYTDEKPTIERVDTEMYTCWRNGVMRFNAEKLSLILHKLSEYYGVPIHYSDSMETITCSGSLDLSEDFTKVIHSLSLVTGLKYKLNTDNAYEVE